jgi:peptidyl-tRNA hydrolase
MRMAKKLYIVVRSDLSIVQQAVQACHATRDFTISFPEEGADTLVLVNVPNEPELEHVRLRLRRAGIRHSAFREPDLGDALTAVAIAPEGRGVCRKLSLALS